MPFGTGLMRAFHYWLASTWTVLASRYWAQSNFHNGHGTTPALPDTSSVLAISTGTCADTIQDDNELEVLAEYWLPIPVGTMLIREFNYWLASTWTVLISWYWARSDFHNRHGTTLALTDTGSVLAISTGACTGITRRR